MTPGMLTWPTDHFVLKKQLQWDPSDLSGPILWLLFFNEKVDARTIQSGWPMDLDTQTGCSRYTLQNLKNSCLVEENHQTVRARPSGSK